ncbi:hypothetical protein BASA62_004571 [Batrachochytrium salamandrivorans]|nr:hypothetical protein BASA62_004571 [Batrachochytrium salamandrivorans]
MTSNTFNFNATFCFSLNRTVTPVARGSPSGGSSAANIRLDGQFQFSASIRVDMDELPHRAILPVAIPTPVDTTIATPATATPVAEPSWLKKAMRNDRPFWESPKRSSKRVIPPVRARVHPDSVPEDWVTTYIDNEPRTFYYPMKQY